MYETSFQLGIDFAKLIAKHLVTICFIVAMSLDTRSAESVFHGTYFLALVAPDYIVVAIDSRQLRARVANDRDCKIRLLSANAFFFATGATSAFDNDTHTKVFDAGDIAQHVYAQFGIGTASFADMAQAWAIQMENVYKEFPTEFAASAAEGTMAKGFFAGEDKFGNIAIAGQIITYQPIGLNSFNKMSP